MAIDWDQLGTRVDEPALEATDWDAFGTRVEDTPEPEPSLPPMAADMPQMLSSAEVIRGGKRYPEQPKQERKFSVLQDEPAIAPVDNVSRAPVTPETRAAINAAFDADTDGGRARLTGDAGFIGQIARQRQAEFDRQDLSAAAGTQAAESLDPRAEERTDRLVAKGEKPEFARRAAQEAAARGVQPGKEVEALAQQHGLAEKSDFDFDTKQLFDPQGGANGLNNPLVRGLAKGVAGMSKAATGYGEFLADLYGLEHAKDVTRKGSARARGVEDAIGEHGTMLERNLEGAIGSIAQQLPAMVVGAVKGVQAIPLAAIAVQTFGQEYSDGRKSGQGMQDAATRAGLFAVFEVLGERFGLGDKLKAIAGATHGMPSDKLVGFMWSAFKKEVPGELLTTTGQFATDKLQGGVGLNTQAGFEEYMQQAADTVVQTMMQSALMTGGGVATSKAVRLLRDGRGGIKNREFGDAARALSDALSSGQLAAPDAAAMAAIVNQDAGGALTPEQAQARMAGMAQAQARLDALHSGQQADATLAQTAQIRDAAQAQARQAKSESVTAIGQASTVDEAIVATQRAVGMDEQELADWALQQAGIDPAALTTIEAQAQAQRQAAQEMLTQEVVTDGTQTQETQQAGQGQQAQRAAQAGAAVAPKAAPLVLQNRDRSTSASITQMNAIAASPDYLRTGPSRTMDQGAPVVFGDLPAGAVLGRAETVADGTGRRVQVRYAVVEAPSVLTSNSADGLANAGYADGRQGMVRAVAGNARGAGLIESWNRGTAQTYRQELLDDAQSLGIDAQAIAVLQRPMLVRLMDAADVTPDMGDRTNIQAGAAMSAVEQAANDVHRVDVRELQFDDAGNPTRETLAAFVNQMPVSERGAMLNSDGTPTKQAIDRLVAAAFKQAYDNDALVELAAQATDPEARTVINALASVAGDMAQLAGTGEFDIRQAVSEAAQKAVNARRRGLPLQKALQERDLQDTPEMLVVAQFMADNIRSGKRIADGLRAWARLAREQVEIVQGNAQSAGLFGEAPTLSRAQIFERLGRDGQTESAQRGGPEPLAQDTGRQDAPEREREAGSAQDGRAGSQERATQAEEQVGEWAAFGPDSGTLGIARAQMPQIKAADRSAFLQFLQARGIDYTMGEADPATLRPTQAEFSTEKVARFVRGGGVQGERSVVVSSDNYVLDGHHQWLGHQVMGQAIPVIRLDAPIREVLQAANEFPSVRRSEGATNDDTQRDAALRDFKDAMADLADLATKWQRAAIVPEQHPELMQTLVRLFDAAIRIVGTDLKAATKWVRDQLKSDPKTKSLLLKIKQSTYQQAAQQALREMQGAPQGGLFGGLKQASEAVQSDELPQAKPYSQMSADEKAAFDRRQGIRASDRGRVSAASYDMARDNFKPPKISAFIPDSLMAQVRNKIAQLHTAATPGAISAADKARAHAMLTPLLERAREAKLDYDQRVIDIARETGALGQMLATIKSMDSVTRKLVTDPGVNWDLGKMYDTLRSTIVVSSYADAQKVLDAIRSRFDVIPGRVKNVTDAEIDGERGQFLPSGYGQVLVNVRLPGGVIAEIQINTPEMLAVKLNEGHALYEIERAEPDGSQAQRDAVALQNEIYPMAATAARERAFMASERSRSSLDLAEPGDIGKSRAAVSRSEPVSSSNANTRPSGNLTHSVMSPFTANSQPAGNLSGTFIDTSDKSIVSDEGESGKDGVLESYTPAELKARQDARDAAERERANEDARAERKDDADAQRDSFTLTGSDRAADDVNQSDLFGNSAGPKEEVGGGRQRFTVSIPVFGDVPYRASAPVQADGRVLSSRVITSKTPISRSNARLLGLPEDKGAVYAWRVSVVQGQAGPYSIVEAMAQDHGRSTDGEVLAHFKPVDQEVVERVAPAIARAAREDWQKAGPMYSRSASTKAAYEARIDALFAGSEAATGTRVLDRSDVMGMLGHPDMPLILDESHLVSEGLGAHPEMTAAQWKKVPEWIENPALAYKSRGRIVLVAPERVAGHPVLMVIDPEGHATGGRGQANVQLLVTAYAKTRGGVPFGEIEREKSLIYWNTQNAPAMRGSGGVQFSTRAYTELGRGRILTEKHLAGWRRANDTQQSVAASAKTSATTSTIAAAIRRAYGNVLDKLQDKGLVTLAQTEDEAVEAAAKARAAKTGQPVGRARATLRASVKNSVTDQTQTESFKRWFKDSKVVDTETGEPLVVYHGTPRSFDSFSTQGRMGRDAIYLTPEPAFASKYAGGEWEMGDGSGAPNVMPVYVSAAQVFDYENSADVAALAEHISDYMDGQHQPDWYAKRLEAGDWGMIESPAAQVWIKKNRADGFYVKESGVKNIAVYRPEQIKSAIGNNGNFDPADPDIRRSASGSIQGFYDPQSGQSFLIADGLTAEAAPGVLVHEVGIHMAADTTSVRGKQAMDALVRRAETLRRMGRGNPFFDRVTQRMRDAGEASREETAAYMAEAYEQDRTNAPVSVKRWVQDFMAAVRAWLFSKGVLIKASQLTPADIAAVARANVRAAAGSPVSNGETSGQVRRSNASPTEDEVRALVAQYVSDKGAPSEAQIREAVRQFRETERVYGGRDGYQKAKDAGRTKLTYGQWVQTRTENFRNWFGDWQTLAAQKRLERVNPDAVSKVVDPQTGEPLVVYHGTHADFSEFKSNASTSTDSGMLGGGHYFSPDPQRTGGWYANKRNLNTGEVLSGGNVMPVFLNARNPLEIRLHAGQELQSALARLSRDMGLKRMPSMSNDEVNAGWAPLFTQALRERGHDGVRLVLASGVTQEFSVFDSGQIKSATGNVGTFDGSKGDIRFSRGGGSVSARMDADATFSEPGDLRFRRQGAPAPAAQGDMFPLRPFTLPDEKLGGVRRKLQDGFIRALHVQNAVAEQGGVVNEATDFYLAEELSSGKRKALADDLKDKEIKPLVERMAALNVDMDELALYAYAMHAQERNAHIATINPRFADGGSGMTNAEADAVLAQVKAEGREQAFADLHTELMRIVDGTRRLMRDSGLITAQQYQAMQSQYQNYIPLRGFEAVEDDGRKTGMPAGRGINIRGSETVRALGRASRAGNLIETAIVDRLRTIDRSERNQVGKVFLNFVRHNPDPALWEIDAARTRQALDRQTGQVNRTTTIDKGEDTISVKVGGREVYIRINDPLLLRALRNTAKEERGELEMAMMRSVGLYSTLLRNTLTRYNPEFALTNAARDFGFGTAAIVDELGEAAGAKFIGYYAGAIGAAHRYEKGTGGQAGKRKKSEWDRYFNEFRMAGGMTAGFYVKGIDEVQKDVRAMLLDAGAKGTRKELLTRNPAAMMLRKAGRVLEWSGSVSENAARVAAYRVAREAGKTPSQAASIAKNLTTNFDRKGEYGQVLNANYVFYNAAVQGSHRMLKMLANPRMLGWMAGMGAAGVATAMLSASMGGDDPDDGMAYWDKIPDYVKERNFIIMLPPGVQMEGAEKVGTQGRYIKIPLQYGLNLPIAYGYVIGDVIRNQRDPNRGMNFKKAAVTLTSYFFGAFNPFDGSVDLSNKDSVILATLPSTFDFLYQQAAGVNGFGRPVAPYKSDFDHKPDSENYNLRQADSVALKVARWLNSSTGGNEAKPGAIDVSAGTIENLIRNLTGGTGTFIYDSVNLAWSAVDSATGGDPDVFVRDVPLARRVYGTLGGDVDQGLFYENRKQADEAFAAAKGQLKIGIQPEPEERAKAMMHKAGTNVTKTLAKIRREMIRVTEDENLSKEQRATRLRELRAKRDQLTSMYNQRFREAMGKFFAEQSSKKESE